MLYFLLFLLCADALEWYSARNLKDNVKTSLIKNGCYRGTYGINLDLHLFNCLVEGVDTTAQPFAILSQDERLCVVEMREREGVMSKLKEYQKEVTLIFEEEGKDEIVIGNVQTNNGVPSLCSRSDFDGAAWNVIPIPTSPMSLPVEVENYNPGAPIAAITNLLNTVSQQNLMWMVQNLSAYHTRQSASTYAREAVTWAGNLFRSYGFNVTYQTFNTSMCNNIIATRQGATNNIVLIGSHLDSRSTNSGSTTARAPGADDNGSGTAANLEFARILSNSSIRLNATLILATFCGEEQGLLGSNYMANQYRNQGAPIIGMYNADMIGYRCGSSSTLTFDSRGVSVNLTNTCKSVVPDYLSGFPIGDNSGCCSDNQGFQNAGYNTVSFFECPGTTVANPNYHRETDLPETINQAQLVYFAKALYACSLTQARPL